jgi:hypothetical protein
MARLAPSNFGPFKPGRRYEVVRAFDDYDKVRHEVGETWTFLGHNFLPYDDGLSLFVSLDGEQEWHIRMQWREEEQAEIIGNFADYVRVVPGQSGGSIWARLFGK